MSPEKFEELANERISSAIDIEVFGFYKYANGFSALVNTELDAYKAAYKYQGPNIERTRVEYCPNIDAWSFSVYTKTDMSTFNVEENTVKE